MVIFDTLMGTDHRCACETNKGTTPLTASKAIAATSRSPTSRTPVLSPRLKVSNLKGIFMIMNLRRRVGAWLSPGQVGRKSQLQVKLLKNGSRQLTTAVRLVARRR